MKHKERGFTLIEVLASILILSIIGVIIWNVFIQGSKYAKYSLSKNALQQEANYVITNLTRIHQTSTTYQISSSSCQINVTYTKQDGTISTKLFDSQDICYSTNFTGTVNPNEDDINLTITLSDKKKSSSKVDISTILYRLKDGGI